MEVLETATISEKAAATASKTGTMKVRFISPGWGSSGHYSAKVLEDAAARRVIPAGTHMYADHPTKSQRSERPERSIKDLMAVTTTDAQLAEDGSLVGEVRVMAPFQSLLKDLAPHIGVSILGDATDIYEGEADGRRGRIIAGLAKVDSVDFVTRAGRGGQVLQVLESASVEIPGLSETTNDTRAQLESLLTDAYGGKNTYVDVRDFDEDTVWFCVNDQNTRDTFAQPFATDGDGSVKLDGDRVKVRAKTTYVPVEEGWTEDGMLPALEDLLLETIVLPEDEPELLEVITSAAGAKGTAKLNAYWSRGEGAAKIRWGVSGDFDRCVSHLGKYIKDPKGYCAKMHKQVTGATPGHAAGESATDDRVITIMESGLGIDQDGHSYRLDESGWAPVLPPTNT